MCNYVRIAPVVVFCAVGVCLLSGCGTPAKPQAEAQSPVIERSEQQAAIAKAQVPISAGSEVDLVERVASERTGYREALESLLAYYNQYGYLEKGGWVEKELRDLRAIPRYPYLGDRQAASPAYEAKASLPQADALYEQARKLHTEAGGLGSILGGGKDKLEAALKTYRQLIDQYPTSDKIDDAAFYIGEIYASDTYKEYTLALNFYQRCLKWNPNTEHPVPFRMAVVYDYRLRDRDKALALYRQVVQSSGNRSNVRFAQERIRQLTDKGSHEAPEAEPKVAP